MSGHCFVIMGYGRKSDPESGRVIDLDKTYKWLIKPVVTDRCGLACVRADEIRHSGTIDVPMFENLLKSDVVIADITTLNPNALYELGVRHALRPFTTIVIGDKDLKYPFDINHTVILPYVHGGEYIDVEEAERFRNELEQTINVVLAQKKIDSPVYTFLGITPPAIPADPPPISQAKESLGSIIDQAEAALASDDIAGARILFEAASVLDRDNPYVIQRLALTTYKSKQPTPLDALHAASKILADLEPEESNDPETTGIAGAIEKRLHELLGEDSHLDKSLQYYERGFIIRKDYYNGINFAYLLNVRAVALKQRGNEAEAVADAVWANRVRKEVLQICQEMVKGEGFQSRDDQYWVLATIAEAHFALGNQAEYSEALTVAATRSAAPWMLQSTHEQIEKLSHLIGQVPLP